MGFAEAFAEYQAGVKRARERQAQRWRIPYHPVLAGVFYATAAVTIVVTLAFAVLAWRLATDEMAFVLGAMLLPLAIGGLGAAVSVTAFAVNYARRRA